jgi:hypothetical protein
MEHDPCVDELLLRWEQLQAQGQVLTVEELCRDCPEYRDEVARRIRGLQAMRNVLDSVKMGAYGQPAASASQGGGSSYADYNLLFGILALQMDFVSRDALIAAMHAWMLDKAKPLAQILVEQGALAVRARNKLEAVVELHLEMHEGDPQKSLAAVSSIGSVRQALQEVADPELQASLVHVSAARPEEDPWATQPAMSQPSVPAMRFRILHKHAEGGLGAVFVAHDEELHRQVALKEIKDQFAHQPESRSRFLLEAEVTGGLEHPGIVPVYGLGCYPDGRPFYAMRFIKGHSLWDAIQRFHAADTGSGTRETRESCHKRRKKSLCGTAGSAPPRLELLLPEPDDPAHVLWLPAKILEPRYALAAMVLRVHRHLHQCLGNRDVTRQVREPRYPHRARQSLCLQCSREVAQAGVTSFGTRFQILKRWRRPARWSSGLLSA